MSTHAGPGRGRPDPSPSGIMGERHRQREAIESPAAWLTTPVFATVLAVVKSWGRIRGGRTPGVQRR